MENPATDEVRLVIQFLKTKDFRPVEIHRQIAEVCVEGKMNGEYVRKWYWLCKEGTTTRNRVS
jgi:elongation factor P hydroxylase